MLHHRTTPSDPLIHQGTMAYPLLDVFTFARSRHCVMVTYFNYPHRYWKIDTQTLAGEALKEERAR